jgi:hypothetical protein
MKSTEGEATHIQKRQFRNGVWWAKVEEFRLILEELGFEVGDSSFGLQQLFSTPIKKGGFEPYKTSILNQSWKWTFIPNKRGTNLETKLPRDRHMS